MIYRGVIGFGVSVSFVVGVGFGGRLLINKRLIIAYLRDLPAKISRIIRLYALKHPYHSCAHNERWDDKNGMLPPCSLLAEEQQQHSRHKRWDKENE